MILTKTTKMKWHSLNKEYYIERGYIFTKMKDGFEVNVAHLPNGSEAIVIIKCDGDNCNEILTMRWTDYTHRIARRKYEINNKDIYYCKSCAQKLYASKTRNKNKINNKNTKSFEEWCIENNRQDILDRWDYELNDCKPNEITYGSHDRYWFKCQSGKHNSELKIIYHFTEGYNGSLDCNQCNSFAQYLIDTYGENALLIYWSNKNVISPWNIMKGDDKCKVWIKCQEKNYHEDYEVFCSSFAKGNRCPYCVNHKVHPKDSLGQYIIDNYGQDFLNKVWSDKNKKSAFEYSPMAHKKVWWCCFDNKHEDYYRIISNSTRSQFRCKNCQEEMKNSILQEKVTQYINSLGYNILHENNCTIIPVNPKTKCNLPFDNELILINKKHLLMEINGNQHYELLSSKNKWLNGLTPKQYLYKRKLYDRYKRIFASKQGYFYLEIPYWTDDQNETWKQLIDNKINELLF